MTDTDIDADIEPPLEPEGPWQVCSVTADTVQILLVLIFMAYSYFSMLKLCCNTPDMWDYIWNSGDSFTT